MARLYRLAIAAFVAIASLVITSAASAGPYWKWFDSHDNPPPSYPPIRYWAPTLARIGDSLHRQHLSVYPPDRHPEVSPSFDIIKFPRSFAPPSETLVDMPVAPESSKAK